MALHKAEFSLPFFSICSSIVLLPSFVLVLSISGVSLATTYDSFVTSASSMLMTEAQVDLQLAFNAVHAWGVCWRFSFGINPTKSATTLSSPLCGRPDCHVHLGGVPLPRVQQYRFLGVVLSPTLSWGTRVDFLCFRRDRLFHQASAWCLGEGLPLSFLSSIVVPCSLKPSFGLEFIADDPLAVQSRTPSLVSPPFFGWPCFPY